MAESKEDLKSFLMKVKKESEKVGLKLNIQKTKIMTSSPIIWWQIDGETIETVTNFILGVSNSINISITSWRSSFLGCLSDFSGHCENCDIFALSSQVLPPGFYYFKGSIIHMTLMNLAQWLHLLPTAWVSRKDLPLTFLMILISF